MPAATVKSYAKKSGKSIATVEGYWEEAKKSANVAWKGKKKDEHYWAYVSGIVKKRCGLTESVTFKEFVELSFYNPEPTTAIEQPAAAVDPEPPGADFNRFSSCIFAARDKAHELHLATKSYAEHVALNDLYELLLEFADEMTETYQGKHGLVQVSIPAAGVVFDQPCAIHFIQVLTSWLETTGRSLIGADSFIINKFEELVGEVYRIKYRLDNLS